ncbi:hypothetical protein [Mesorhizobium sp. M1405]|uniref:hypothetical protein n=1 Tax=unclassified Mesorhizobium TaxID=325217 RepID=UPI00333B47B1
MAKLMGVGVDKYARTYCHRFYDAWADGRYTYEDYLTLLKPGRPPSKFLKG